MAMVWDSAGLDVGGKVAGEHQLLCPWLDQLFPFFTVVASKEEVFSVKLLAVTVRKTVKEEQGRQPR